MRLPVTIPLRFSRQLTILLAAAHAVAAATVLPLAVPWIFRAALLTLVAVSLLVAFYRQRWQPVTHLHLGRKGELILYSSIGAGKTVYLLPQTTFLPGLIVLAMRCDGRRRSLVLLPDATSREDRRRLRVWLIWQARAETISFSA